jgi:hypothetical protein
VKRLRHPIRSITEPFGKAGLIVAIVALVAAIGGTAFAASGLNSKQKKEVTSIAKKYAGKPGAPGEKGANGTNGTNGKDGTNGTNGTSAETIAFAGNEHGCAEGGLEVKSGGPTKYVCNGVKGTTGFTEKLPAGKTETGTWALGTPNDEGAGLVVFPISFNVPLPAAIGESEVIVVGASGNGTSCSGTATQPKAEEGDLCIYTATSKHIKELGALPVGELPPSFGGHNGASVNGAIIDGVVEEEHSGNAVGSWAVTAE